MDFGAELYAHLVRGQTAPAWLFSPQGEILAESAAAARLTARDPAARAPGLWGDLFAARAVAPKGANPVSPDWGDVVQGLGQAAQAPLAVQVLPRAPGTGQPLDLTLHRPAGVQGPILALPPVSTPAAPPPLPAPTDALSTAEIAPGLLQLSATDAGFAQWLFEPETGVMRATGAYFELLGFAPGEAHLSSAWVRDRLHPEDRPKTIAQMEALLTGQRALFKIDYRLRCKQGDYKWFQAVARRAASADGRVQIAGSLSEITQRKRNEDRLKHALAEASQARRDAEKSERLLHLAIDFAGVAPWYVDPATGAFSRSDQFGTITGYTGDEVSKDIGEMFSLIHPDDQALAQTEMAALFTGQKPMGRADIRLRHKQGHWVWCTVVGVPIGKTAEGRPELVCGATFDITERRAHEEDLARAVRDAQKAREEAQEAADILRHSTQNSNVVPWYVYPDHKRGKIAAHLSRILGYSPEMVIDRPTLRSLMHPDDLPGAAADLRALESGAISEYKHSFRLRRADGSWCWFTGMARRIERVGTERPLLLCGSLTDIHHLKANEERLEQAAQALHEAHDRFVTMAENAPGAIFECRVTEDAPTMHYRYFSAQLPEMTGVSAAEIEADGAAVFSHVPPEDRETFKQALKEAIATRGPLSFRPRVNHPTRGPRDLLVFAKPSWHADGSLDWYGNVVDVTEQASAERQAAEAAAALRRANDRFLKMAERAPVAIYECRMSAEGRITFNFLSAALLDLMGVERASVLAEGRNLFARIPPEDSERHLAELQRCGRDGAPFELRYRIMHPKKGLRWVDALAVPHAQPDGAVVWYGSAVDVTERMAIETRAAQAVEDLKQAHERLNLVADISTVAIFEYRMFPDGRSDFPYSSARFHELTGYSRAEIDRLRDGIFQRVHPEDLPGLQKALATSARTGAPLRKRFRLDHPSRGMIWVETSAKAPRSDAGVLLWSAALSDVSADVTREMELRRAHRLAEDMRAENEHQALHDGLTGLPNRRYYDKTLAARLARAQERGPTDCTLIRVDLDHFKYVNDTLGHEAGDMVLVRVAEVLRANLRGADFAARIGGDEFSILLAQGTTEAEACALVERVRDGLAAPLIHDGRQCRFGASFGIAYTQDLAGMGPDIQMFADAALYRAKESGRNRMELFTPQLHAAIQNDRRLAVEIHEGLDQDQFEPFFQPQVCARTGELIGVETLLRWNHPQEGVLAPDAFMHVAEQLRLVSEIDRIMMQKARDALGRWRAQGFVLPKISFNVSSGRMHDPDVVLLAREMVSPDTRVTFELLESILIEKENDAFRFHLDLIREAGVDIEIDDFGSGHASIIGLMEIAPSALKIDKRIVLPVARDDRARALVGAIVEIAETLGIETVAEGVETEDQATILRDIGCNVLQGYLFAKPLSESALVDFMRPLARRSA
ncbi:hypothetical protein CKO11_04240 [Rhodobacter sp. TJ_12]|uniref:PAS domain-containing protein n=1 Tax=Rhodobacter sp. TJ_12 TaxID=2029399 RepID=UPI001CBD2617|nr:PAS domain-containing protein [Rhodobacter sp. TJ_12]MBZ4021669.1 hypothetical protein [Rhodobacter sp. TJ_12]